MEGNVLDIAIIGNPAAENDELYLLYSVDNVHVVGSTSTVGDDPLRPYFGALCFQRDSANWLQLPTMKSSFSTKRNYTGYDVASRLDTIVREQPENELWPDRSLLSDLLYGIEHLRKRGLENGGQDESEI